MNIFQKAAALFGAQYAFMSSAHSLTFHAYRAYKISGRWYLRALLNISTDSQNISPAPRYYMLTPETRCTKFLNESPNLVTSEDMWIPLTDILDAAMSMMPSDGSRRPALTGGVAGIECASTRPSNAGISPATLPQAKI